LFIFLGTVDFSILILKKYSLKVWFQFISLVTSWSFFF